MHTKFEEIYKLFLASIQDFHLDMLFTDRFDIADDLMFTFLIRAIPLFKNCVKDLNDVDIENKKFNCKLDLDEITILADWMTITWFDWNNNNTSQMNLNLIDTDFKIHSEDKNVREKTMYVDRRREIVSQRMTDYGLKHTPFRRWAEGIYGLRY